MSRVLQPTPRSLVDPVSGRLAFGSYLGPLPAVDLGSRSLRERLLRRKRWFYVAFTTGGTWIAVAVVKTGYAASAFGFACDLSAGRMRCDRTVLGPAAAATIADDLHAVGPVARFAWNRSTVDVVRDARGLAVAAALGDLEVDARLTDEGAPPPLAVLVDLGDARVSATEKRALLPLSGRARAGGVELALDGGFGGYDYTHGVMPRRTRWKWAFAMGADAAGESVAFNLTEGFVGGAECASFAGTSVSSLGEPAFLHSQPLDPWQIRGPGVDLTFAPAAVHTQVTKLVLVRSNFVQVAGSFSGQVDVAGRPRAIEALPGVVEDQDVVW